MRFCSVRWDPPGSVILAIDHQVGGFVLLLSGRLGANERNILAIHRKCDFLDQHAAISSPPGPLQGCQPIGQQFQINGGNPGSCYSSHDLGCLAAGVGRILTFEDPVGITAIRTMLT